MKSRRRTLRTTAELCEHGLVAPERRAALEQVAARYAVAVPDAFAALIDRTNSDDPIARQFIPRAEELNLVPRSLPIRSATMRTALSKASCTDIPTGCCSSSRTFAPSIVGSASAARWSVPASPRRSRAQRSTGACLYRRASGNLGGDPHRRRSVGAVAAPPARGDEAPGRDRARQGRAYPYPHAGGGARAHHAGIGAGDQGEGQGRPMSPCTSTMRAN